MISEIENYLCDLCDTIFNDGIVCDKAYNIEQRVNRAANVLGVYRAAGDQGAVHRVSAKITENRETRSQCVTDVDKIRQNIRKIGVTIQNGLVIYIDVQYITMPIKIVVGTQTAYTISATLNITVK